MPVYVYIDNGLVQIRDASHLWGKTALETQECLQQELGQGTRVMAIGPAGENQVTFATILATDNAVGSSGFGAVMGSKKLKEAIGKVRMNEPQNLYHPGVQNADTAIYDEDCACHEGGLAACEVGAQRGNLFRHSSLSHRDIPR